MGFVLGGGVVLHMLEFVEGASDNKVISFRVSL